jgi:hypothetical protein
MFPNSDLAIPYLFFITLICKELHVNNVFRNENNNPMFLNINFVFIHVLSSSETKYNFIFITMVFA